MSIENLKTLEAVPEEDQDGMAQYKDYIVWAEYLQQFVIQGTNSTGEDRIELYVSTLGLEWELKEPGITTFGEFNSDTFDVGPILGDEKLIGFVERIRDFFDDTLRTYHLPDTESNTEVSAITTPNSIRGAANAIDKGKMIITTNDTVDGNRKPRVLPSDDEGKTYKAPIELPGTTTPGIEVTTYIPNAPDGQGGVGLFCVIAPRGTDKHESNDNDIWFSPDGESWTGGVVSEFLYDSDYAVTVRGIMYDGNKYYLAARTRDSDFNYTGRILSSSNGFDWVLEDLDTVLAPDIVPSNIFYFPEDEAVVVTVDAGRSPGLGDGTADSPIYVGPSINELSSYPIAGTALPDFGTTYGIDSLARASNGGYVGAGLNVLVAAKGAPLSAEEFWTQFTTAEEIIPINRDQ